jgi:acyl-CoA thioester hydrolase
VVFPETVQAGLRVGKLGNSSVRYEVGIFAGDTEEAGADGYFVHVFVDAAERDPVPIPEQIRASLERLVVDREGSSA